VRHSDRRSDEASRTSAMSEEHRRLIGTYETPLFEYGDVVICSIRGEVELVGITSAPIPWPVGKKGRHKAIVVYGGLEEAIRRESASATAHHFGVGTYTIWKWRTALGIGAMTEGTQRLKGVVHEGHLHGAREAARPMMSDPARRARIRAAKLGKARPPESARKTGAGHRGMKHTEQARKKMSETHKARGTGGKTGKPWTEEEDGIVRKCDPLEATKRTGRTLKAVWSRRRKLRVNSAAGMGE
jgi:hypothetical protein